MAGFSVVKRGLDPERPAGSGSATGAVTSPQIASVNGGPPLSTGPLALQVVNEDITAALQADITAGNGAIYIPDGTSTISSTITNPGGSAARLYIIGQGQRRSTLKLANGVNDDLVRFSESTFADFRHLGLDPNRANNSSGYGLNLPDTTGYQGSALLHDALIAPGGTGSLYCGVSRNELLLQECSVGAGAIINGIDCRWTGGTSGSGVLAGQYNLTLGGTNFKCFGIDIFNSLGGGVLIGFNAVQTFWEQCKINNNAFNGFYFDQWAGGLAFQNIPNNHEIIGCTFSENSGSSTGTYSDILLHGVVGINIDSNFRFESSSTTFPKYHVEDQVVNNPAGGSASRVRLAGRYLSTALGAHPLVKSFATGVTNVTDITRHDQASFGALASVTL